MTTSGAALSEDRLYRFLLTRAVSDSPRVVLFIGVNPSTADEEIDDATIRRMTAFAKDGGFGVLQVANLFAQRTPKVSELRAPTEDVAERTDLYLSLAALAADQVVCAWGPPDKLPVGLRLRWIEVVDLLQALHVETTALEVTKDGHPKHPLYLSKACTPTPWPALQDNLQECAS